MTIVLKFLRQCLDVSRTAVTACSFPICGFFNHFSFERKPFLADFAGFNSGENRRDSGENRRDSGENTRDRNFGKCWFGFLGILKNPQTLL